MQPETKFKNKVLVALRALPNVWLVKVQQVGLRGTPDILACVGGHFVALELKRDAALPADPLQAHQLDAIRKAGGSAFVAAPQNWPTVLAYLAQLAKAAC